MKQPKKFYPKWISTLLLIWSPILIYLAFLMLKIRDENRWLLLFILPLYILLIYILKKQEIPKGAKPVYISKVKGYIFFFIFSFFVLLALIADIWSKEQIGFEEIFSIILSSYVYLSICVVSYLLASHRIPSGYTTSKNSINF